MGETEGRLRAALKVVSEKLDQFRINQPQMSVSQIVQLQEIRAIAFKAYMDISGSNKETTNDKKPSGHDL